MSAAFSCREAARLASEAMERKLSLAERIALRFHLVMCRICRKYNRQIRFLHDALRKNADGLVEATDAQLTDEAKKRIKESLSSASG